MYAQFIDRLRANVTSFTIEDDNVRGLADEGESEDEEFEDDDEVTDENEEEE